MTAFHFRGTAPYFDGRMISGPADVRLPRPRRPAWLAKARRFLAGIVVQLREASRRRRVIAELSRLSDRELADIGLHRAELPFIYSRDFISRRNSERCG